MSTGAWIAVGFGVLLLIARKPLDPNVDSTHRPTRNGAYVGEIVAYAQPRMTGFANPQYGWQWSYNPEAPGGYGWSPVFGVQ